MWIVYKSHMTSHSSGPATLIFLIRWLRYFDNTCCSRPSRQQASGLNIKHTFSYRPNMTLSVPLPATRHMTSTSRCSASTTGLTGTWQRKQQTAERFSKMLPITGIYISRTFPTFFLWKKTFKYLLVQSANIYSTVHYFGPQFNWGLHLYCRRSIMC